MRVFSLLLALLLLFAWSSRTQAGKYNPALKIGDKAPDWSGLEGIDGERHSLKDLADKEVVVICFTCNTCEYAVDYEDRLVALAKKFDDGGGKCALVAINPNLIKEDLLPAMQERAKSKGFEFLYVHDDAGQQMAKSYGATYTPEFMVLNKERKVVYLGAMDDSPNGKKITKKYVEDAASAALAGKLPETTETPAVGCVVRWKRERSKK